jgi:chemotaxis protein CheD
MTAGAKISKLVDPRLEAAQKRIRESIDRADTLEAVREIVTNLLGCEEIALFAVEQENRGLLWSFGIDPQRHDTLDSFDGAAMHRVMHGEIHIDHGNPEGHTGNGNPPLRIFVPIRLHGRTVAVLVMLKLLPQKVSFDKSDIRLVKLLSDETGKALFGRSANATA